MVLYKVLRNGGNKVLVTKVVGCILIILSSSLMGIYYGNELKNRVNDLKELKKLIILLRGDIRFSNTPLPEAISGIARRHDGSFKGFFTGVSEKLSEYSGNTFSQVWKEAVENQLHSTSLNKKDKSSLIQFGENLGYLDKEMQMNTIELFINQMEDELQDLSETTKEKVYLYKSLGIMGGIFISIIMI